MEVRSPIRFQLDTKSLRDRVALTGGVFLAGLLLTAALLVATHVTGPELLPLAVLPATVGAALVSLFGGWRRSLTVGPDGVSYRSGYRRYQWALQDIAALRTFDDQVDSDGVRWSGIVLTLRSGGEVRIDTRASRRRRGIARVRGPEGSEVVAVLAPLLAGPTEVRAGAMRFLLATKSFDRFLIVAGGAAATFVVVALVLVLAGVRGDRVVSAPLVAMLVAAGVLAYLGRGADRRELLIGTDGVLYRHGYRQYAWPRREIARARVASSPSAPQAVELVLTSGETVRIDQLSGRAGVVSPHAVVAALDPLLRDPSPTDAELELLDESARHRGASRPAWLRRLANAESGYRAGPFDRERLASLLDDERAAPAARAVAAAALRLAGALQAPAQLRVAASNMVSPKLRVALERVADAADDAAALAEATERLETIVLRPPHAPWLRPPPER